MNIKNFKTTGQRIKASKQLPKLNDIITDLTTRNTPNEKKDVSQFN